MTDKTYCTRISQDNESSLPHRAVEQQAVVPDTWQPPINFDPRLSGEPRKRSLLHLQQNAGNRAVQRMIDRSRASADPTDDLAQRIRAASLGGSALDSATRYRLQESLNADLSSVRIHTDEEADRLSRSVEAIAFTTGSDIFFRRGAYQPNTASGLHLLAHEAVHTIQQANGPVEGTPASAGDVLISDPADHFEQAAERAADQLILGVHSISKDVPMTSLSTGSMQQAAVQREESGEEGEYSLMGLLSKVINPFTIQAGEKGLEHLAEEAAPLVKASLSEASESMKWLQLGSGSVPVIGGGFELAEGIHGVKTKSGFEAGLSGAQAVSGGLEMAGGGATMASTLMGAGGMAAPEVLGTIAKIAGPAGAVLGSGVMGAEAGTWLNKNTSAGETTQDAFSLMDKGLTGAAQGLGIMGKGENKSAYLSATNWVEEHPVVTTLTEPLWAPVAARLAILGGGAAAGAGLGTGVWDLLTGNTKARY